MVPALALLLRVLLAGRRDVRFADCNVFALRLYGFTLIWLSALFPVASLGLRTIAWAGGHPALDMVDTAISALVVSCVTLFTT